VRIRDGQQGHRIRRVHQRELGAEGEQARAQVGIDGVPLNHIRELMSHQQQRCAVRHRQRVGIQHRQLVEKAQTGTSAARMILGRLAQQLVALRLPGQQGDHRVFFAQELPVALGDSSQVVCGSDGHGGRSVARNGLQCVVDNAKLLWRSAMSFGRDSGGPHENQRRCRWRLDMDAG